MNNIAILTSGGDGPGLNAAIRAVGRQALKMGVGVFGVRWGYTGLISSDIFQMESTDLGGIMGKGGTILGTARCPEFKELAVRRKAIRNMNQHGIDGLIVIGGNGSLAGANALHEMGFPTIGVPASIDNDVDGTSMSVGVDTTLNTILDAIDRIKDTASSHQRAFLIEVMGRNCGYLALAAGVAGGAEMTLIPEHEGPSMEQIADMISDAYIKGKHHCIIVVAEGWKPGTNAVADYLKERREELGFGVRVTVLGYVQRGGSPSAFDRILATRMGAFAAESLIKGESGFITALRGGGLELYPTSDAVAQLRPLDLRLFELTETMY